MFWDTTMNLLRVLVLFFSLEVLVLLGIVVISLLTKSRLTTFAFTILLSFIPFSYLGAITINDFLFLSKTPDLEILLWSALAYLVAGLWLSRGIIHILVFLVATFGYYLKSGSVVILSNPNDWVSIILSTISVWFFLNLTLILPYFESASFILRGRIPATVLILPDFFRASSIIRLAPLRELTLTLLFSTLLLVFSLISFFIPTLSLWNQPLIVIALGILLSAAKIYESFTAQIVGAKSSKHIDTKFIYLKPTLPETLHERLMRNALSALIIGFFISWTTPSVITTLNVRLAPFVGIGISTIFMLWILSSEPDDRAIEWLERAQTYALEYAIQSLAGDAQSRLQLKLQELKAKVGQIPTIEWDKAWTDLLFEVIEEIKAAPVVSQQESHEIISLQTEADSLRPRLEEMGAVALALQLLREEWDLNKKFDLFLRQIDLNRELYFRGKLHQEAMKHLHSYLKRFRYELDSLERRIGKYCDVVGNETLKLWIPRRLRADNISWFAISIPADCSIDEFNITFSCQGLEKIEQSMIEQVRRGEYRSVFRGVLRPIAQPPKQATIRVEVTLNRVSVVDSGIRILDISPPFDVSIKRLVSFAGVSNLAYIFISIILQGLGYPTVNAQLGGMVGALLLFIAIIAISRVVNR